MNFFRRGLLVFTLLPFVLVSQARALVVRGYDKGVNKRLLDFPKLVYHVNPSPNPDFIADATRFYGIGWPQDPDEWTRQMALVSPRHMVFASHYRLTPTWRIIFLGNDGKQHLYGIERQTPIINSQGEQTDLMLVTLSSPVETGLGIHPFPVLNLPSEADFADRKLLVCGSFVDSGTSTVGGHTTRANDPGFDTTRFIYFDYNSNAPNKSRAGCMLSSGDSGAPSFIMVNGRPAIVGTASCRDDLTPDDGINGPKFRSYLSSIPSYLPKLDALMEMKGYHMERFYPEPTRVSTSISAVGKLRQTMAGRVSIKVTNSGAKAAHNLNLILKFPTAPATVGGAGWICEKSSPRVWNCRRGGISSSRSTIITASWTRVPVAKHLQISAIQSYDGSSKTTTSRSLPISSIPR